MKKNFLSSSYQSSKRRPKTEDNFIPALVSITAVISFCLIFIAVMLLRDIPKDAFIRILSASTKAQILQDDGFYYPSPTEEIRIKADRLREIRYEDYLEHCYISLDAEMDNVYKYDYSKKCYLTFDDGPSSVTPQILDVLKLYKTKATFFVTGIQAKTNPSLIKEIVSQGHSIGNHTYSHDYSSVYESKHSFKNEVLNCKNAIDEALGYEYDNLVFRFPGGYDSLTDEESKLSYRQALSDVGYKYIDWSCLTGDSNTTEPTAEFIMETLKSTVGSSKTGDIVVLMHDSATKEITAKTLPKVIEYLYSEGYEFETLENIR